MRTDNVLTPLEIVAMGVVGITIALTRWFLGNRRAIALKGVAQDLKLSYDGNEWSESNRVPQMETALFARGADGQIQNIISGNDEKLECSFFDYGYGLRRASVHQTVAVFSRHVWLPPFEIAPQDILHKLSDSILGKEIRFDSNPIVSQRFRVASVDPDRARKLFTPELLNFLESLDKKSGWRIEGCGRSLIIYRKAKIINTDEMPTFVRESTSMAKKFFDVSGVASASSHD